MSMHHVTPSAGARQFWLLGTCTSACWFGLPLPIQAHSAGYYTKTMQERQGTFSSVSDFSAMSSR